MYKLNISYQDFNGNDRKDSFFFYYTEDEVLELMDDVLLAGVSVLTIGQYLQPSRKNIPVSEYVTPECFEYYRQQAVGKGFKKVESAPLVRSSYHAEKHI